MRFASHFGRTTGLKGVGVSGPVFEGLAIVGVMGIDVDPLELVNPHAVFVTVCTVPMHSSERGALPVPFAALWRRSGCID